MIYNIESKNDIFGAMIIIKFPEGDLDKKALYTIENESPDFLVPFTYRSIDGMAECTYNLGNRTKLQYRFGNHSKQEYIDFWTKLLTPLVECDDYFLKPFSFVMDSRYLYADKDGVISYLYVPSMEDCEDLDTLQEMVMDLSKKNNVSDPVLENKVLKSIMQGFRPKSFLEMLMESAGGKILNPVITNEPKPEIIDSTPLQPEILSKPEIKPDKAEDIPSKPLSSIDDGEIRINLGGDKASKKEKPKKEKKPLFGGKKEIKDKPVKEKKSLFGGKKESEPKEMILGAGAVDYSTPPKSASVSYEMDDEQDVTMIDEGDFISKRATLRLIGNMDLPREIVVDIATGESFTIGRFDASVGRKQSDFEFVKSTKAVSRRHAAIEREENGYFLVDLASSAGTYINGKRLTPNVPELLYDGCEVRFGTSGANYRWEQ